MTNRCPFCGNYAYAGSVGDAYQMDCRYCDIQVEITKRAYSARCPSPVAVLDYIREKMKTSTRPRVDLADMKRSAQPVASRPEEEENMAQKDPGKGGDALTTAAKAIGATLGKFAVKTGIASPPAAAAKRKAPAVKKAPAAKRAPAAKAKKAPTKKTASRAPAKSR